MNFEIKQQGGVAIVKSAVDKLNAALAPELKSHFIAINKDNVNRIVLDMSDTNYCDSSGLSAILTANRLCKDSSGKFIMCGIQPTVKKMIEIAQLDRVLFIEDTLPDALAAVKED